MTNPAAQDHPRVLHVGFQPIGAPTNSGITLGTMFGAWPEQRLLQVCLREHPELSTPDNVVVAPPSIAPVDGFVRRLLGKHVPSGAIDGMNNSVERKRNPGLKTRVRILATAANDVGPVRLPADVVSAVARFDPHVLHSLLGGVRAMRLALRLSERFDIPIVPHFMDDWPDNLFRQGQLRGYARRAAERDLERVLNRSPLCLVIGRDMQRAFEDRYQRPCHVVGNSVDLARYGQLRMTSASAHNSVLTLRYVGGLHLGRDEAVRSLAEAVERRVHAGRRPWALDLFVPASDAGRADALAREFAHVHHRGSLSPDEVPHELVRSSALLFLESDRPGILNFTRLSVSTKVPQYLASGRPVLVLGPSDQGSVRALRRGVANVYLPHAHDPQVVSAAIDELESRIQTGTSGADPGWLAEEFGTGATQERLLRALFDAADGRGNVR